MQYSHLTLEERDVIQKMKDQGFSNAEIARELGRDRSTIGREIERNNRPYGYISHLAQKSYRARRLLTKPRPKRDDKKLMTKVRSKLKLTWSPEQISNRLRMDSRGKINISHDTIYQWIWEDKAQGGKLFSFLRQSNRKRRKRYGKLQKKGQIPGRVFIDDRPQIVDSRKRFGDWEADTIQSAGKNSNIATFVERKSRFLLAVKLNEKSKGALNDAARKAFRIIPKKIRKTMTVDNGKEFAGFKELEKKVSLDIYFAHPYHAWERGANENMNGLLRQFFPKKKSFRRVPQSKIDRVVELINNRPRKCLNYRTPSEVLRSAVALQT